LVDHHHRTLASRTSFRRVKSFWLAPKGVGRDDAPHNDGEVRITLRNATGD